MDAAFAIAGGHLIANQEAWAGLYRHDTNLLLSGDACTCSLCGAVEGQDNVSHVACPSTTFLGKHSSLRSGRITV
jgi:hypothetical protein